MITQPTTIAIATPSSGVTTTTTVESNDAIFKVPAPPSPKKETVTVAFHDQQQPQAQSDTKKKKKTATVSIAKEPKAKGKKVKRDPDPNAPKKLKQGKPKPQDPDASTSKPKKKKKKTCQQANNILTVNSDIPVPPTPAQNLLQGLLTTNDTSNADSNSSERKRSRKQQIAPLRDPSDDLKICGQAEVENSESPIKPKRKAKGQKKGVHVVAAVKKTVTISATVLAARKIAALQRAKIILKKSQLVSDNCNFTIFPDHSRGITAISPGQCVIAAETYSEKCSLSDVKPLGGLSGTKSFLSYLHEPHFVPLKDLWKCSQPLTRIVKYSSLQGLPKNSQSHSERIVKTYRFFGHRYQSRQEETKDPRLQTYLSQSLVIKHPVFNFYNKNFVECTFLVFKRVPFKSKVFAKAVLKKVKLKRDKDLTNVQIFVEEDCLPGKISNVSEMTERNITPIINTASGGLLPLLPNRPKDIQAIQQQIQLQTQVQEQNINQQQTFRYIRYRPHTATEYIPIPLEEQIPIIPANHQVQIQPSTASSEYFSQSQFQLQTEIQGPSQSQPQPHKVIILPAGAIQEYHHGQQFIIQSNSDYEQLQFQESQQSLQLQPTASYSYTQPQQEEIVQSQPHHQQYAQIQLAGSPTPTAVRYRVIPQPQPERPQPQVQIVRYQGQNIILTGDPSQFQLQLQQEHQQQQILEPVQIPVQVPVIHHPTPPQQQQQRQLVFDEQQIRSSLRDHITDKNILIQTASATATSGQGQINEPQQVQVLTQVQQQQLEHQLLQHNQIRVYNQHQHQQVIIQPQSQIQVQQQQPQPPPQQQYRQQFQPQSQETQQTFHAQNQPLSTLFQRPRQIQVQVQPQRPPPPPPVSLPLPSTPLSLPSVTSTFLPSNSNTVITTSTPPAKKPKKPRKSKKEVEDITCQLQAAPSFPPGGQGQATTVTTTLKSTSGSTITTTPTPATLVRISTVSPCPTETGQTALKSYPSSAQSKLLLSSGSANSNTNNKSTFGGVISVASGANNNRSIVIVKQNSLQKPTQVSTAPSTSVTTSKPSDPNRPAKKEGCVAVCPHCGLCNENLLQCKRCRLEFPATVKVITQDWAVGKNEKVVGVASCPQANPTTTVATATEATPKATTTTATLVTSTTNSATPSSKVTSTPIQKKIVLVSTPGSGRPAILDHSMIQLKIQPDGSTKFINLEQTPNQTTAGKAPVKRRAPQRKREQECITLSSDEEEETPKSKPAPVPSTPPPKKTVVEDSKATTPPQPTPTVSTSKPTATTPVKTPQTQTSPKEGTKTVSLAVPLKQEDDTMPKTKIKISLNLESEPPSKPEKKKVEPNSDPPTIAELIENKLNEHAGKFRYCTLEARSIRMGSYKVTEADTSIKLRVSITELGILFLLPHCSVRLRVVKVCIPKESILRFQLCNSGKLYCIFLSTGPKYAKWVREILGMDGKPDNDSSNYYCPQNGNECQKTICILFDEAFKPPDVGVIRNVYHDTIVEIDYKKANALLMKSTPQSYKSSIAYNSEPSPGSSQSSQSPRSPIESPTGPKIVSTRSVEPSDARATEQAQTSVIPIEETPDPSEEKNAKAEDTSSCSNGVVLLYEGRNSKVSISRKDITCLGYAQFLNDQVIEFWLAVILTEIMSEEDRKRTFIFDSYFYTKLTEKMKRKTAEDGTMTAAERRHSRVKKRTKNVDIFEKDFLIIPINENYHWFLVIICFPGLRGYHDYDTLKPLPDYKGAVKTRSKASIAARNKPIVSSQPKNPSTAAYSNRDEAPEDPDEVDQINASSPEGETSSSSDQSKSQDSQKMTSKPQRVKHPCIIVFDSLAGEARARIYSTLREYLRIEYKTKKGEDRDFDKTTIPGCMPKVPQQPNFSDCGLFMLQYVESFFKTPPESFEATTLNLKSWFSPQIAENKRKEIYQFIYDRTQEKFPQNLKLIPQVIFEPGIDDYDDLFYENAAYMRELNKSFSDEFDEFEDDDEDDTDDEDLFEPAPTKKPKISEEHPRKAELKKAKAAASSSPTQQTLVAIVKRDNN